MIVERVKAGGKVLGRPRVSAAVEAQVVALRKQGAGYASDSARTGHREVYRSTHRGFYSPWTRAVDIVPYVFVARECSVKCGCRQWPRDIAPYHRPLALSGPPVQPVPHPTIAIQPAMPSDKWSLVAD